MPEDSIDHIDFDVLNEIIFRLDRNTTGPGTA